jgi:hypothetical protein
VLLESPGLTFFCQAQAKAVPMNLSTLIPKLARAGSIAAAILIVLTIAWVILLIHPSPPPAEASAVERLAFIEQNEHWQTASFMVAALMAIAYLPVWLALGAVIVSFRHTAGVISVALGVMFSALLLLGYWTQLATVQNLLSLLETNTDAAIAMAGAFNFSGNFWTASYGIVIAAFVVWGLTTLTIFSGLIDSPYRPAKITAALFGLAGLLALVGAVGFAAGISFLEHGILISGVMFVPALSGTVVFLHRIASGNDPDLVSPGKHTVQDENSPVMSPADAGSGGDGRT